MRSPTAEWYDRAATRDLVGHSAVYVEWAAGVAADDEVRGLIDRLPREHRQPSLIFSIARWLGAASGAYPVFRTWLVSHWSEVEPVARTRRTQTNEPGRCAPLLAALDRIPGPLALLEVGAAAGLCLAPDRYAYRFDDGPVLGTGLPLLACATSGEGRVPVTLPHVVWRRGIDLQPRSIADADDVRWLEALLPPDRPDRTERLRAAVATLRADPPVVVRGDALDALADAAAEAPASATLVVVSLGTLVYLPPAARAGFPAAVADVGARLVTLEAEAALPAVADRLGDLVAPDPTPYILAVDGEPIACASPHGDRLSWLSPASHAGLPGSST